MDSKAIYQQAAEILGPEGRPIAEEDLPPPNTKRWVSDARRPSSPECALA